MNRITDYGKLATDITNWIKNYAQNNGIKSLVVGVSGGIDSAVVSTLCGLTGLPTYCISIDIDSREEHLNLSDDHVLWLSTAYSNVWGKGWDLTTTFRDFCASIPSIESSQHTRANSRSRLRMVALYHAASHYEGIVVGTGNKVEDFGVGFYTKYGDGGVDISPIADLYKSEVRELSRHLGISQDIIDAVPTDGLWEDGRCDEDQIGATYEELEWAMDYAETHNELRHPGLNAETMRKQQVWDIYHKLHQKNLHKMLPIPIYKLNL